MSVSVKCLISAFLAAALALAHPTGHIARQTSPSNIFTITPTFDISVCLTAPNNKDGGAVIIEPCTTTSASQNWTEFDTTFKIYDNMCLDVTNGNTSNGTAMQIWSCVSGDANQQFSISVDNQIVWDNHDECLDLPNGDTTSGTAVEMSACVSGASNQEWFYFTASPPPPPPPVVAISPGANSGLCLTAPVNEDGGSVIVETCNAQASQNWTQSGSNFVIYGTKCLDVTNGKTANGVAAQIWTCTSGDVNQEFTVTGDHRIAWTNHGQCLDLTNGNNTSGTVAQLWACGNNDNFQVWNIGPPPFPNNGVEITPGASSSVCLTAPTNANGGSVVIEPCTGAATQTWTQFESTFIIHGNKCLDVTNGNTANGVPAQIWDCTPGDVNQEFSVTSDGRIAWTDHGQCLDLTGGNTANSTVAQLWACTSGDKNQVWNIQ